MKSIKLIWLFFSVCLLACVDDTSEVAQGKSEMLEQVVLKLNVQKETVVQTRATTDANGVNTIDFFVFNAKGNMVIHEHPSITKSAETEYKMSVNIPSAVSGEHTLFLVANHQMNIGTITTLEQLKKVNVSAADGRVDPPFVMATEEIKLANLNVATIQEALQNSNGKFNLKRNVAKFSIGVTASNFKLDYVEWKNFPKSASVLLKEAPTSSDTISIEDESLSKEASPIYFYQIPQIKGDVHQHFHVLVGGTYEAADGTSTHGYYKLQLCTEGANGIKQALTSIEGNTYYKLDIRSVSGTGFSTIADAEKNGFSNDMAVVTILDFTSAKDQYREAYSKGGYQLGFANSYWQIYSSEFLQSHRLGYFYRTIRDASLRNYTTFDPDYPRKERRNIIAKENGNEITGMKECFDDVDKPIEMELCFTDSLNKNGKSYTFTSVIQYGVLQKNVTIERHPSMDYKSRVIPMLNTNYGEVISFDDNGEGLWLGLAAQRHDGVKFDQQLSTDNDNIFIHITENKTTVSRQATIQLFGINGYRQMIIRQDPK